MNIETSSTSLNSATKPANHKVVTNWHLAINDIKNGLINWPIWLLISWQDIRLRYRRSSLGPFWITISMAISIYTMGFLYGHLFKMDLKDYYPFLAMGMLSWNFIYILIVDGTNAFIESENYLKQMKLYYSIFVFRIVSRALIIFLHNILVIVPIILIFHVKLTFATLLIFPALLIIVFNGFCYGMVLAMIGARYRDVIQIIVSLMQVAFFLTPIMWNPSVLPQQYQFVVALNPFAQFIDLLRDTMLGQIPSNYTLSFTLMVSLIGFVIMLSIFTKVRKRIIYWL